MMEAVTTTKIHDFVDQTKTKVTAATKTKTQDFQSTKTKIKKSTKNTGAHS